MINVSAVNPIQFQEQTEEKRKEKKRKLFHTKKLLKERSKKRTITYDCMHFSKHH